MSDTDSPLDEILDGIAIGITGGGIVELDGEIQLRGIAEAKQAIELYCHKQVIEGRKEGYDHNLLGSWIFIGDNARLNNLDGLYWSYVQEFVAKDNPYREEPYEKMEYIKKTMPYASFSKVGIFKLLARADQNAKERIAELRKTL